METILVTGGAGYIGSHACKALAAAGYEPVVFDNLVYGHREAVRWGPLETGDIADEARMIEVIERYRPIAAMHFAAYAYVGESMEDPILYFRNNVLGTINLTEAMLEAAPPPRPMSIEGPPNTTRGLPAGAGSLVTWSGRMFPMPPASMMGLW